MPAARAEARARRLARAGGGVLRARGREQLEAPLGVLGCGDRERLERLLVEPRALLVGEQRVRALGRALRRRDRLLRAAARRRLEEVVRDLGERRLVARREHGLERFGRAAVQAHALRRAQLLVERLPHQRVRERVVADALLVLDEHAGAERLAEPIEQLGRRAPRHAREQRDVEGAAEHRGGAQHLVARRPRARRDAGRWRRARSAAARARSGRSAGAPASPSRRASSNTKKGLPSVISWTVRASAGGGARPATASTSAATSDGSSPRSAMRSHAGTRASAPSSFESGWSRRTSTSRKVATTSSAAERSSGARNSRRAQRRLVGPVQIVEHEHERALLRAAAQQPGERVEEPEARLLAGEAGRGRQRRQARAQLGHELRQLGRVGAERRAQPLRLGRRHELAQHLHPGPEGRRALAFEAAPDQHLRAALARHARELLGRARLADAGLAGEQHEPAAAGERRVERALRAARACARARRRPSSAPARAGAAAAPAPPLASRSSATKR